MLKHPRNVYVGAGLNSPMCITQSSVLLPAGVSETQASGREERNRESVNDDPTPKHC